MSIQIAQNLWCFKMYVTSYNTRNPHYNNYCFHCMDPNLLHTDTKHIYCVPLWGEKWEYVWCGANVGMHPGFLVCFTVDWNLCYECLRMIVQFPLALPLLVTILAKDGSNGGACQPLHSFCCSLFFESLRIAITLGERDLSFHVSTLVGIELNQFLCGQGFIMIGRRWMRGRFRV